MSAPPHSQTDAAEPTVVSLFTGCGGLDLGFQAAGFEIVYACDNDRAAVDCYRANLGAHIVFRDVTGPEFLEDIARIGRCDVVLGGFPCQGFSKAGPKRRDDARNLLYERMQAAVHRLRPSAFIAENVDGIQQNFGGAFVERIRAGFSTPEVAYRVHYGILNAVEFGVPQHRRRAFFVGVREDVETAFEWPAPTHEKCPRKGEFPLSTTSSVADLLPPRTLRDAITDLPEVGTADHTTTGSWPQKYEHIFRAIGPGQKLCNVRHASTSVYTWQIPEAFGETTALQRQILETIAKNRRHKRYGAIPNGNPIPAAEIARLLGLPSVQDDLEVLEQCGYVKAKNDGFDLKGALFCSGLFKRPSWDEPSMTVLTNFHNPRFFLHPLENRPLTLRECARLQTFPDSFEFTGTGISLVDGYRLVGNAVPPRMSRAFAESIAELS